MNLTKYVIPNIGSDNNQKRLTWVADQLLALPAGIRLLDAGAGTQYFKRYCKHLKYVAQDFAAYVPDADGQGLHNPDWNYGQLDIVSDITDVPEPDASFDAILCSEVMEHLPDPNGAIREFSRLLKPQGVLIMTAPFCALTHQSPYFFSTGFSQFYYEKILGDCGFKDVETVANGSFFEYMAQESKRLNGVSKRYTDKALTLYQKIVTGLFIRVLNTLNKKEKQSGELLCYGYFVKATKK